MVGVPLRAVDPHSARNAAQGGIPQAEQRVHLSRRVFINAAGMVNNAPQTNNAQQKLPGTIRRAKGRIQNTKVYMQ